MAAAAAAAEAAGKLPRAAGTRGVRNTPENGEVCLGRFSFLKDKHLNLKIANTLNKTFSFLFNRSDIMTKLSWTKNISF